MTGDFERKSAASAVLRAFLAADYAEIASWVPDAMACVRWAGPRVPFPFSTDELATLLTVAGGESYCLTQGEAPVCGFGQHWVLTSGSVHLGRLIVSPAMRGRGFGRQLCRQLITRAIEATGASAVTLRVYRDNFAAVALYGSLGFARVEDESAEEVLFMRMRSHR